MTRPTPPDERIVNELLARAVPGALGAERIASTGAAPVYRVVDPGLTSVVVKVVAGSVAHRATRLHRDVGRTPGLLGLLRAGGAGDFGYLVFPHLAESLADRMEAQPLSGGELARILSDVADGLNRLHRLGYVHGDIKPGNILLTADGRATLTDLDDVAAIGSVPLRVTPGFGAPEQFTDTPVAPAADLYALAAVVLTALTGTTRWMTDPAAALSSSALPGVTPAAVDALRADLSAVPSQRVIGPTELLSLLAQVPPAPPPSSTPRSAPFTARPDTAVATALVDGDREELIVAARRAWGFVDLRAATLDRLPLQIAPEPDPIEDELPERSIWRRPAMIVSLIVAVLLVATGLVLALVL